MKVNTENRDEALPGEGLDFSKMPGHWLLAQMGKRVLRPGEWSALLAGHGFTATEPVTTPMHLLEPGRFIRDEGLVRSLGFIWKVLTRPAARRRISGMRSVFRTYAEHIGGITIVGVKTDGS